MQDSILNTIKQMLDISPEDPSFDMDVRIHINSAILVLSNNDIVSRYFHLNDDGQTWAELDPAHEYNPGAIADFIYAYVKPRFDGTISGTFKETLNQAAQESIWRLKADRYGTPYKLPLN